MRTRDRKDKDLFLCRHCWALPLRASSSCGRFCCQTERRSSHRSRSGEASRLGHTHTKTRSTFLRFHLLQLTKANNDIGDMYLANPSPSCHQQGSAQRCSCKLCSTHQNAQAYVSVNWNTRQRIAHNHPLRTEKVSLLEVTNTHTHTHLRIHW